MPPCLLNIKQLPEDHSNMKNALYCLLYGLEMVCPG